MTQEERRRAGPRRLGLAELQQDLGVSSTCAEKLLGAECREVATSELGFERIPGGSGAKSRSRRRVSDKRLLLHPGGRWVRPEGRALVAIRRSSCVLEGQHVVQAAGSEREKRQSETAPGLWAGTNAGGRGIRRPRWGRCKQSTFVGVKSRG